MKKKNRILILLVLVTLFSATMASANANATIHIYLYEKDSSWNIVEDGAWGKIQIINNKKELFVFNGHQLLPGTAYTLISYSQAWSSGCKWLGDGIVDENGDIHIMGTQNFAWNSYTSGEYAGQTGAKIWLVLTADYNKAVGGMKGWHTAEYLFEGELLPEGYFGA